MLDAIVKTLEIKGKDYGVSHDVHINFTTVADLLGMSKYQVLAVYLLKHVQSVTNAISKQPLKPQTGAEPIEGRLVDIINYCLIMMCMLKEDNGVTMPTGPELEGMSKAERTELNRLLAKERELRIQDLLASEAFHAQGLSNAEEYAREAIKESREHLPSHFAGLP